MGFNPPVPQQDSDWEIRAAVQVSLLLQALLIFMGPIRKRSSQEENHFIVWSCYLLADWFADLALGLLLNNMGNIGGNSTDSSGGSSPIIFAFWTPFLLLHLGGPDTITAYSLEDNELWLRHLIGLLFELFSACVIFFCSLRGNPLIHATVLMFVIGIIKYAERTYSLYFGSVNGFRNKILDPPEPGPNYAKLMTEYDSKKKAGLVVEIDNANGEAEQAHKEMEKQETRRLVLDSNKTVEARAYEFFLVFRRLFVNVILSFKERRRSQAFFLERENMKASEAFEVIEVELNFIYDMVYTKAPVAYSFCGWVLRCICSCCLVSALLIFFFLDKPAHGILPVDVGITYALLLGGLALDAAALLMIFFSDRAKVYLETNSSSYRWLRWLACLREVTKRWRTRRWSGKTSQLNLIGHSNKGGPRWLRTIAEKMHVEEIVDDFVFIRRVPLRKQQQDGDGDGDGDNSPPLLKFIFEGLKQEAQKLTEMDDIMEIYNYRGKRVIQRLAPEIKKAIEKDEEVELLAKDIIKNKKKDEAESHGSGTGMEDISKIKAEIAEEKYNLILNSVEKSDFDESLLLWHIATDLCGVAPEDMVTAPLTETQAHLRPIGETLSDYMLYLLIKQPEMLAATAGIGLLRYRDTCEEARRFFGSMEAWMDGHDNARRMLLSVNTSMKPLEVKGDQSLSVLFDAVILAKELRRLDENEALKWELVSGVWVEMLTYAAGKCRGDMHVRQLNRGGELITLVWFLMAHMGFGNMYRIRKEDSKVKLIVKDQ